MRSTIAIPEAPSNARAEPSPRAWSVSELYREHGATVARWAQRLGGPELEVEDATHEVFAVVQQRLLSFRGEAKITTWLFGITENVVSKQRRRGRIRRWLAGTSHEVAGHLPSSEPMPLQLLEQREASARVYAALDKLREPYRSALILFELEELSGLEIAELKQVPIATVWVWLHRARAKFLAQLGEKEER